MRLSRSSSSVSPVKKGRRRKNPSSSVSSSTSASASSSSSKSPRGRKKQKRLDAICEKAYNRNRLIGLESNRGNAEGGLDSGLLRRSTRVRRAPEVLDASPSPAKKRRRIESGWKVNLNGNNERSAGRKKKVDQVEKTPRISNLEDLVEPRSWKSRLRSRAGNVGAGVNVSRRGKRKLFDDGDEQLKEESIAESDGEMDVKMDDNEGEKSPVAVLRKQGSCKTKGLTSLHTRNEEIVPSLSDEDEDEKAQNMDERFLSSDEQENLLLNKSVSSGDEMTDEEEETNGLSEKEEATLNINGLKLDEEPIGIRDLEALEQNKEELQEATRDVEEGHCKDASETVGLAMDGPNNGESFIDQVACWGEPDRKHIEDGDLVKENMLKQRSNDRIDKPRVREGRRCGLCGRGTDGRPPKRLVRDNAESDNERYDGLSSSDEFNYDIWDGFGDEAGWLGRLLGPIHDRFGIAGVWVHQHCAVWSPEVYFAGLGHLKNVRAALYRGRSLKCSRCGRPGATIGCRVDRCPKTYHLPCGRADRCIFDHRKFLIACPDHRYLFEPEGEQYTRRIKKLKAKKMKLELWKLAHDASQKDIESEEKWLENCGEDEEFLKREGKRLHRDLLRIAPVYIGGSSSESEKLYQGWESVAGLQEVIQCMKEVVLLPILYPEFFSDLGLTPPRGVLLHGYPGTGKTLVVRALIGSCSRGDRRIAYFAQKGADCLGKYVGDAERQLRLLFQVAERSQPSIIFFDEIDGLAPCRTRQQDQTHNSVVSTLLALMDGLKSRGSVIVIGATNRPDAVDPALRRPGRFDREIYFPLPSVKDRAAILTLHTQRWRQPLSGSLLNWIAQNTAGFAGADLQSLCTQAAMVALKRNCSLQELMSAAEKKAGKHGRLHLPAFHVEEQDWLDALASAPPPCSRREAGMATNDVVASPLHAYLLIPSLLRPLSHLLVSLYLDERIWLPPSLYKAAKLIKRVLVSALKKMDKSSEYWWSYLPDLIKEADVARQIERDFHSLGLLIGSSRSSNFDALSDDDGVGNEKFELQKMSVGARSSLLRKGHHLLGRKSGFRIMISGYPKSGQRHLASCLLYGFVGHIEIQKVDFATISQEGHGDVIEGVTHILLKCASTGFCVIYMPRVDLWATEAQDHVGVKEDDYFASMDDSADTTGLHAEKVASRAWTSFIEQADSMSLSSSLMILATSEVPIHHLPQRISQFFRGDSLNCNTSAASEDGTLRFIEQVDGNFDCNMMINSSAMELSYSLIQQYVQLIHCSSHFRTLREKVFDAAEGNLEDEVHNTLYGAQDDSADAVIFGTATSNGDASRTFSSSEQQAIGPEQCPPCQTSSQREAQASLCYTQDAIPRIFSTNRTFKGKSALLFAISSLGYQILRYPHFAELCWVTSKLKQGPCTVINGPWKGWPFNSCIIRPNNSLEKLSSTSNLKSKEHKSVVRGLVAVGILAYKGVYTSVRDVSLDVRKVLGLLVGQINAKIIGGKDKYRFLRLQSQVAYLDDMVNSWAYSLQSLERDSQISLTNSGPKVVANHKISGPFDDHLVGGDGCKPNMCPNSSHELSPQRLASECDKGIDPYEEVSILHMPNSEARSYISEDASKQMVPLDPSSGLPMQSSSTSMDLLVSKVTEKTCNVLNDAEQFLSEHRTSAVVSDRDFVSSNQLNSLAMVVLPSENGVCRHDELDVIVSCSRKDGGCSSVSFMEEKECPSNKDVIAPCELDADANDTSNKNVGVSAVSGLTCFYSFCSDCMHMIYILIRKILIHEKKKSGSCRAVDDVHDVVASCSANLSAAVRAIYDSERIKNLELVQEKLGVESYGQVCACEGAGHIQLNDTSGQSSGSENSIFRPMMCSSHSENKSIKGKTNDCTDSPFGLGLNFLFRDGVLIPSDPGKDILFHCKFEKLCLRSLIERILVIKQPLG